MKRWEPDEIAVLREEAEMGYGYQRRAAQRLGRSPRAVRKAAHRRGIAIAPPQPIANPLRPGVAALVKAQRGDNPIRYPGGAVARGFEATIDIREHIDRAMREEQLALIVEKLLDLGGWNWYHPYRGEMANTILDYICWRERTIWIELKTEKGILTRDRIVRGHFVKGQVTVLRELREANAEVYIWRPRDYEQIKQVLLEPRRAA